MSMRRENGRVLIDIDEGEYLQLMMALGNATGSAIKQNELDLTHALFRLANSINEGNPNFRPYVIGGETKP